MSDPATATVKIIVTGPEEHARAVVPLLEELVDSVRSVAEGPSKDGRGAWQVVGEQAVGGAQAAFDSLVGLLELSGDDISQDDDDEACSLTIVGEPKATVGLLGAFLDLGRHRLAVVAFTREDDRHALVAWFRPEG